MELVTGFAATRAAAIRQKVIDGRVEACSDAIPALVAGLEHSDPFVRIEYQEVLERVSRDDRDRSVLAIGAFLRKLCLRTPQKEAARRALDTSDSQAAGVRRALHP